MCTPIPKLSHTSAYLHCKEAAGSADTWISSISHLCQNRNRPRRPLCVVSVIGISFACLQVQVIQQKISLHFLDEMAISAASAALSGDFSILAYPLHYSRWLTVAHFSACVWHMFWKLWLSVSLRLVCVGVIKVLLNVRTVCLWISFSL